MDTWTILGAWTAAAMTLFVFSFLYEDNPLFRAAEHLFTGLSLGYMATILTFNTFIPKIVQEIFIKHNFWTFIPLALGILMLTRFFPRYSYMSRIGFAFIMGFTSGLTIPAAIVTRFMKQLQGSVIPLVTRTNGSLDFSWAAIGHDITSLIGVVGLLSVLIYFFFSVEHKGVISKISKVGIYFIMIYLGAAFGTTVMGRFSLLYGRIFDLYTFRGANYYYATPVLLGLVIFFLTIYLIKRPKAEDESEA